MKRYSAVLCLVMYSAAVSMAQEGTKGLRGEPEAIAEANAMVESMGGTDIWRHLKSVHFVHRWYFWNRIDTYVENEVLDLTGPRSWVEMKSEIFQRLRAYSPEHKYWNVVDGEYSQESDERFAAAQERAPFHWTRIARGIAAGDPYYEVRIGSGEFPGSRQLDFYGPDGIRHGWIVLNVRKEPIVWATTQYQYIFGPMKRFGNLRVPNWAVTADGAVTYEMISLAGSDQPPDSSLFAPPSIYTTRER